MTSLKAANGGSLGYVATYHGDAPGPCGASICCPHGTLEFLPWHRLYTVQMDTEVRTQNTGVTSSTPAQPFTPATLPYWDWTTNSAGTGPMTALPDLVSSPMIMDPISGTLISNPFFNGFIPGVGSNTVRNPLPFLFAHPTTTLKQRVLDALGEPTFALFSELLVVPHNEVHIWTGGFPPGAPVVGSMADTEFAAYDPIFYLHHNMIDLVWAVFQYLFPVTNPVGGILGQVQNPFNDAGENPQEITGRNNLVSTTLDYEDNLCYTYSLTGNPFERALDINSNNIVFGGMNLSQIRDEVLQIGNTEHFYAGFFRQSFGTSYQIHFNICHFNGGQKVRCFPGGVVNVFGGRGERAYVNDIVTKIDITDKLKQNHIQINEKNICTIEIERVQTLEGKEMSRDHIFRPVTVRRYKRNSIEAGQYGLRDKVTVHFGQAGEHPPKISILEGTLIKLANLEVSAIQTQFYEAPSKEVWAKCDIEKSKQLTDEHEEPSIGEHFYFMGNSECSTRTRVFINTYWAPRNDMGARNLK